MPILDNFVRGTGETSPFNLSNHTPDAGGAWSLYSGSNFVISPDSYARLAIGGTVSVSQWNGDPGSDNYEAAVSGFFRSSANYATLAVCTKLGSGAGILHRLFANGTTLYVNIQDAFTPYTERAGLSGVQLKTNNAYLVVGSVSGTTFTTSVKDLVGGLWLTSAGTFSSATRVAAITATITHSATRGRIGIQDYVAATDTTGSSFDVISYGTVGSLGINPPTAVTLTGPTSGTIGQASADFMVQTDNPLQSGSVIVTPSDGGNGGTFTPATVTLTSSVATATFTYTAASAGTKTISVTNNASLTNPSNISYVASTPSPVTAYTLTGPSTCNINQASSNFTVALGNGILSGTVAITPSSGAGGGTFNPSSVSLTNASRTAIFTYTAASAGSKTIATTNNGGLTNPAALTVTASADQTIYCDNSNIVKSPSNWSMIGTAGAMSAETVWPGSYMRLQFNGTAIAINVNTTGLSAYPWVLTQIDSQNPTIAKLTAGQTVINIAGLAAGNHELNLIYQAKDDYNQANTWGDAQKLVITSLLPSGGTGVFSCTSRPKRAIIYGDSITAGLAVTAPPGVSTAVNINAATASYANHIGVALNAEFDQAGCGADGWTIAGVGGFPALPNSWNLKKPGISRSLASHDYVVVLHGYNDGAGDIGSSIVTNWITAVRATSTAWIFICVPFSGRQRGAITTGVANYISANPSETKVKVIDLGFTFYQAAQSGYYTTDGVHPNSWQGGRLAAAYLGGMVQHIGTSPAAAVTYRGGFRKA
jgi:hypothetical protein